MKILLFSLESINNAGDEILRVTTEYLINMVCKDSDIHLMQLTPRWKDIRGINRILWIVGTILRKSSKLIPLANLSFKVRNIAYVIAYKRLFKKEISNVEKVILPIGMLKYSTQNFSYVFYMITSLCGKYGRPVLMSGMSPERGNTDDWRYLQLVKAVNALSVTMITTRDGQDGVRIIKNEYLKRDIPCDYVGDPALWVPETYRNKYSRAESVTPLVGINIIRKDIFDDYNKSLSDKDLVGIYRDLITELDKRGWKWKLFCNGMKRDWKVIQELKSMLNISKDKICKVPRTGDEFVWMITQFDVVFGARLHSCITSVSLGIPVVGFIWDDKLKFFSETMKISQFFFCPSDMTAQKIVAKMDEALSYNFDFENRDKYKLKTKESIRMFMSF